MRLFSPHGTTPYLPSFEQVGRFRGIGMMQTTVQETISILKAHVCKMPLFTITDDSNLGNMLVKSSKLLVLLIDVVNTLITIEFPKRTKKSVSRCRSLGSRKHPQAKRAPWHHIVWTPCRNDGPMPTETCGFRKIW